ncbi:MAG TPA: GNAT family N-acetyltransferase [Luteitalea sp.]|nr:GNAT family N-acetyltransferase [Luteitalea sp.]
MFHSGVIEGFYGPPWSPVERAAMCALLAASGLNTYLYCPKDDLHHRAIWREPYGPSDLESLRHLTTTAHGHGLQVVYGLAPGLDIRYSEASERQHLRTRIAQVLDAGIDGVALLFDDIPDRLDESDLARWGSLAAAQADVANDVFGWLRRERPSGFRGFCPTPYCERMVRAGHGGAGYLEQLGEHLDPDVDVFWTGPEIISRDITVAHVREVAARLRRKPVIWDNLHANDYDSRRLYCGPYAGRAPELRDEVRGILSNPNTEFPVNVVAVRTLGAFLRATDGWDARAAYRSAIADWASSFETTTGPVAPDLLERLFDCLYLPYTDGPHVEALIADARDALNSASTMQEAAAQRFLRDATALRDLCGRLATLRNRALFHAIHRRVWDLREELDLLTRVVTAMHAPSPPVGGLRSDFHLPHTYRGGVVTRLQRLLDQHDDGSFTPAAASPAIVAPTGEAHRHVDARIRLATRDDRAAAYRVCLETGDAGADATETHREDPDALGRLFVGPYLAFEPSLSLVLEDDAGVCGYALAALDSKRYYERYDREWRPELVATYPAPTGPRESWSRPQEVYGWYHQADYFCPEPYDAYPSHLHIDLMARAQGRGHGRRMIEALLDRLRAQGSPGVHLGMWSRNTRAYAFYQRLGFHELTRVGSGDDASIYMGRRLDW